MCSQKGWRGGHSYVCVCDSGHHNSKDSLQSLMKFVVCLGDDWRMIWITFRHVRGLDLVSGCGLIYKSGCNLKHHEIAAEVKGRWAFFRFYNSKAVSPGPGLRPDWERAVHTESFCRRQFELFCKAESKFKVNQNTEWSQTEGCEYSCNQIILHDDFELVVTHDLFSQCQ